MKKKTKIGIMVSLVYWIPMLSIALYFGNEGYDFLIMFILGYFGILGMLKHLDPTRSVTDFSRKEIAAKIYGLTIVVAAAYVGYSTASEAEMLNSPMTSFSKGFSCLVVALVGFGMLLYRNDTSIQQDASHNTGDCAPSSREL